MTVLLSDQYDMDKRMNEGMMYWFPSHNDYLFSDAAHLMPVFQNLFCVYLSSGIAVMIGRVGFTTSYLYSNAMHATVADTQSVSQSHLYNVQT